MKFKMLISLLIFSCSMANADDSNSSNNSNGSGNNQVVEEISCVAEDLSLTTPQNPWDRLLKNIKTFLNNQTDR